MTLSEFSIRNPVFAWMLMSALILFGWIGFRGLGVSEMPDVDFPVVTVSLSLEGAAPEIMETDVVDIVEDAITSIQGIRDISSNCQQGSATVTVEFDLDRDIDVAVQEVQTKLSQAGARLPQELDPPTVIKTNTEDHPVLWIGVSSTRSLRELMKYARDQLKDPFQIISGVGEVFLGGFLEPNLRVWIDSEKLQEYELTADDVLDAIRSQHVELPAGRIETPTQEFNVRTLGEAKTPEEFGNIVILKRGGMPIYRSVYLKQVARIEAGMSDLRRISRVSGETAIGLGIRKQRGANSVEVGRRVKEKVKEIQKMLPPDVKVGINFDSTRFIEESIGELNFTLFLSALLTGFVCWLFLGSFTSTLNILLAIPTSIIGTFLVLYFAGFTLNNFTLLALILAIGIVVDDAIMVLENIVRYQEKGESKFQAAITGSRQITSAAIATSLAIVAIFIPVAFMKGIIGRFFFQFGVTLSVAVMLSLLEALTLTPMRCSQFVSMGERKSLIGGFVDLVFQKIRNAYEKSLGWAVRHRLKTLGLSFVLFILSLGSVLLLKKEFAPSQDQAMFMVRLQTPVGSAINYTDEKFKVAESYLLTHPGVQRYFSAVGGFGGGDVNSGIIFITLKPKKERTQRQDEIMDQVRKQFNSVPDLKAMVQDFSMRGMSAKRGYPVEFTVRGPDWDQLIGYSKKMREAMEKDPNFTDVDTDFKEDMPEVRILPNREKAANRGVSLETVARTINVAIGGVRAGKFTEEGRRDDVRVRLLEKDRSRPTDILNLYVRNNRRELVSLQEVTDMVVKPTILSITRINRERAVGLFSNVARESSQSKAIARVQELASQILPAGYRLVLGGSAETFQESFQSLIFAMGLGMIVAYMILASQYNSFIHPFTILLALPFSVSGAFLGLWIFGSSLNIYSMIGIILLMGIVKKNSILLVDFTNQLRKTGVPLHDALLQACPIRLRPILMTSFATIAAAIPPALGFGPGAETRIPMAIAVIGGVVFSTVLTLFVVPVAYSLMAKFEIKV